VSENLRRVSSLQAATAGKHAKAWTPNNERRIHGMQKPQTAPSIAHRKEAIVFRV